MNALCIEGFGFSFNTACDSYIWNPAIINAVRTPHFSAVSMLEENSQVSDVEMPRVKSFLF